ncbi:MAG: outer membrane lipoprotein carrier protein LolA [Alphaproteobacteria bacterium]|nr:outer membrane lipoprotein carrier protein LolA [Alphaproteobacteria bacterium]
MTSWRDHGVDAADLPLANRRRTRQVTTMTSFRRLPAVVFLALIFAAPLVGALAVGALALGAASPAAAQGLTADQKADVERVETYFNSLTTMRSTFLQASSTGLVARGVVWLQRPGRMRFEYAPPSPVLITADGIWLTYQDNELEQTTQIPLITSPLSVLVSDEVDLTGDLIVEAVEKGANVLRVRLSQRDDPDQGDVVLTFQDKPLSLKQWIITDAQGVEVKVALLDPVFGLDLPADLWRPNDFGRKSDDVGR